jgi:hypothetical protein
MLTIGIHIGHKRYYFRDEFKEAEHPRGAKGTGKGGQFVKAGEGGGEAAAVGKETPAAAKGAPYSLSSKITNLLQELGFQHQKGQQTFAHPSGKTLTFSFDPPTSGKSKYIPSGSFKWVSAGPGYRVEKTGKGLAALQSLLEHPNEPQVHIHHEKPSPAPAASAAAPAAKPEAKEPAAGKTPLAPPPGVNAVLPNMEGTKWQGGQAMRWVNNAGTESLVIGIDPPNAGKWQLWTKEKGIVQGTTQQQLNIAFEALHPRGPGGKFKGKPGGEAPAVPAEAPAAKPEPEVPTPKKELSPVERANSAIGPILNFANLKQVGPQKGSNPGGVFEDASGNKYYVKFSKTDAHAANEMLAAALFRLAGGSTLDYHPVALPEGKLGVATKMVDLGKDNLKELTPEQRAQAKKDFAIHAWLANWDAVGLTGDNVGADKNGKLLPLDFGGALLYRAGGTPKGDAFGYQASEWTTMRDPHKNPSAASLYGDMTPQELQESKKSLQISEAAILSVVEQWGPGDSAAKQSLATKLADRRNTILSADVTAPVKPVAPAPPPKPPPMPKPAPVPVAEIESSIAAGSYSDAYHKLETHRPEITPDQQSSLSSYKGSGYTDMNDCMRQQVDCTDTRVKALDEWLGQAKTPLPMTLWRRVKGPYQAALMSIGTVGMRWEERGFVSTSLDPNPMKSWGGMTIKITAPAGMPGTTVANVGESEILFNRGVFLKITHFDRQKKYMECEMDKGGE